MVTTSFSQLVESMQRGDVPIWLREYVNSNRDKIADALRKNGVFEFRAPNGEQIVIHAEKAVAV
jgi:hypothetical protein